MAPFPSFKADGTKDDAKTETVPEIHCYEERLQFRIDHMDNETFATDDKQLIGSLRDCMEAVLRSVEAFVLSLKEATR